MSGVLTHSPAVITAKLLADAGLAATFQNPPVDWMAFENKMPDVKVINTADYEVSKVIVAFDTAGVLGDKLQYSGVVQESHGVQVMLRLNEHEDFDGYGKAKAIQNYFDSDVKGYNLTVTSDSSADYKIHGYSRTSDIIRSNNLESDPAGGLMYTMNFLMFVTHSLIYVVKVNNSIPHP